MTHSSPSHPIMAFIGGGNMAGAIIGGLISQGHPAGRIVVVEPFAESRERLAAQGVQALAEAGDALRQADLVVWAVKPQMLHEAAQPVLPYVGGALHLSIAAGIGLGTLARWLGTERVVRAMPNTPALVGQGMTGLYTPAATPDADRELAESALRSTGQLLWVDDEALIDSVTAVSGSGPAYVFFFIEALEQAGVEMGLTAEQAHQLAVGTFTGASALAAASNDTPAVLRQRVTSKGGTTFAAISSMEADRVKDSIVRALHAARLRAQELEQEFGRAD
ncbi:pyrroline-5-carboxylate reductase [Comamonas sp. BIGb0124]|uniref:pyrroline-5-carboxylate reductase n=1 Tax=Comamonas sp. BIGb0124 TaxID=2485130 RepID=UPI000F48173B|nr:pyrroline-5-carboxylate reductase [Comamonas sp. BIGb0124]